MNLTKQLGPDDLKALLEGIVSRLPNNTNDEGAIYLDVVQAHADGWADGTLNPSRFWQDVDLSLPSENAV